MRVNYVRQDGLVPVKLRESRVFVVGCGTTGSWVVHDLMRMGFNNVTVFDHDKVEAHNLPAQLHLPEEGVAKVESLAKMLGRMQLNKPEIMRRKFENGYAFDYLFSCVDEHKERKGIAKIFSETRAKQLIDIRMGAEAASVIFHPPMSEREYLKSLEVETTPDPVCGRRALLTTAHAVVGIALGHWLAAERCKYDKEAKGVRCKERIRIDTRTGMTFEETER